MNERITSLDLLRGVAAAGVAIPHFLVYNKIGGPALDTISIIAVEIFFVLSGFVLGPQIMLVLSARSPLVTGTFLVRRWMRTIPPYIAALILISVLTGALGSSDFWRYFFLCSRPRHPAQRH